MVKTANLRQPRGKGIAYLAAFLVTLLDGFDAFSLSLAAPTMAAELRFATSSLGLIFAAATGGMLLGASLGGIGADRVGRVRALVLVLLLFASMALIMPLLDKVWMIALDRMVAGVGLGAAAPIAVGLVARMTNRPPSALAISIIWAGIPLGGVAASAFSYGIVPVFGWTSIFIAGGLLPLPIAMIAPCIFASPPHRETGIFHPRPDGPTVLNRRVVMLCTMFFFGYVTTGLIASWLPVILRGSGASVGMVALAFAGLNLGGALCQFAMGALAAARGTSRLLPLCWLLTGVMGLLAAIPYISVMQIALLCVTSATLAAGSQALCVVVASRVEAGREATFVGLAVGAGRLGQFGALGLSAILVATGAPLMAIIFAGGLCACAASAIAWAMWRQMPAALG